MVNSIVSIESLKTSGSSQLIVMSLMYRQHGALAPGT